MLLAGKTAAISGAASARGIGLATARLFAKHGARVAILDLDEAGAQRAAKELGEGHIGLGCDVADLESCKRAAKQAIEAFGQIDILINNAGISQPLKIADISPENWQRVVDVNMTGVLYLSQAFIPHMRERKQGAIACMSSVSAQRGGGIFGGPHYSAAKAGVLGLAKAMARELGPDGIRVNSVTPGLIQTDITGGKLTPEMKDGDPEGHSAEPARRRRGRGEHLPVPRLRPLRLRHRRGDRRQRRHADPLTGAAGWRLATALRDEERRRQQARRRPAWESERPRSPTRRAWRNAPTASGATRCAWARCRARATSPRRSASPTSWRCPTSTRCATGRRTRSGRGGTASCCPSATTPSRSTRC